MISSVAGKGNGDQVIGESLKRAQVTREDFMKILMAELQNQSPLNPMDNTQFLNQLIGLNTLEQTGTLIDSMKMFQNTMHMSFASSFIGKFISGVDEQATPVKGVVQKVVIDKDEVSLVVDGRHVPINGIHEILPESAVKEEELELIQS